MEEALPSHQYLYVVGFLGGFFWRSFSGFLHPLKPNNSKSQLDLNWNAEKT